MTSPFLPLSQTPECQHQQYDVIHTCKHQAFDKIKGYRSNIRGDPPVPAFDFLFRHKPHTCKGCSRCQCICPGNSACCETFFCVNQHDENNHIGEGEKEKMLKLLFCRRSADHHQVL